MPRTTVPITALSADAFTAKPTLTTLTTDGMQVNASGITDNLLFIFNFGTSGSTPEAISAVAGDNPPAFRSSLGDLPFSFSGSAPATEYFGVFESARFAQADSGSPGYLFFDVDTVTSGSMGCVRLPKGY